jgi:uncharacterized phage protein (TIGR02220 family)
LKIDGGSLLINGWERWQTYRSNRGTPPWIKVYRNLLSNQEWALLSDSEKGQLVSIWILAADKKGVIPANGKIIQKMCQLDSQPNISKFIELGFLQPNGDQVAAKWLPSGCQVGTPETETETETETERDSKLGQEKNARVRRPQIPFAEIVQHLNEKAGTDFKPQTKATQKDITARFSEGFVLSDFFDVIDYKSEEWKNEPEWAKYLRPITLFGTKFESYLQASRTTEKVKTGRVIVLPDLDELRKQKEAARCSSNLH